MADKDDSIMLALGIDPKTGQYKKGSNENLVGDLKEETKKTIGEEFDQFKEETKQSNRKLPQLTAIKQASEAGGKALGSKEVLGLMESIKSSVILETLNVKKAVMKTFLPIDTELTQVIDLLQSPNEDANNEALDRIEKIAKALNVDFKEVAAAMGASVQDLIKDRQFQNEDRRAKEELKTQITEERLAQREVLREQGINTVLDKDTQTLKIMTFREEKLEKEKLIQAERELILMTEKNSRTIKQLRKEETLDSQKIINLKKEERKKEEDINKLKEKLNIKPGERTQGLFSQTYGAGIDQIKAFGTDIKGLGRSLAGVGGSFMNALKNPMSSLKSFGTGLMTGSSAIGRFALGAAIAAAKGIGIGLIIGLVIYGLFKLYQAFQKLKTIWPFSMFGDKDKKKEIAVDEKDKTAQDSSKLAKDNKGTESTSKQPTNEDSKLASVQTSIPNTNSEDYSPKILPAQQAGDKEYTNYPQSFGRMNKSSSPVNLNKMSTDLAAEKESSMASIVNAPTSNNIVTNNNTTQSIGMTPPNPDRSFINLNTVAI